MNQILFAATLFAVITFAAVWLNSFLRARTLRQRWEICSRQAAEIVNGVKRQFPNSEGVMCGITADPIDGTAVGDGNLAFEDYKNLLDEKDPELTPFFSSLGKGGRSNPGANAEGINLDMANHQFAWAIDDAAGPDGAIGVGDNYDVQSGEFLDVMDAVEKMGNIGQAFRSGSGEGWISEGILTTPGGSRTRRAKIKVDTKLKQSIEVACCSLDQVAVAPTTNGTATGGLMAGVRQLVDRANRYTNAATGFLYGKPTPSYFAPTAASFTGALATTFTYTAINSALRAIREAANGVEGGFILLAGLDAGDKITQFVDPQTVSATGGALASTVVRMFSRDQDDKTYGFSVGILKTEYGIVEVMRTQRIGKTLLDVDGNATNVRFDRRFIVAQKGFLLYRPVDWHWHWGVRYQTVNKPDLGAGKSFFTRCYGSLRTRNPVRSGFGDMT